MKPEGLFVPIIRSAWKSDEYARNKFRPMLDNHVDRDIAEGATPRYAWEFLFEATEVEGVRKALKDLGVEHLADEKGVNQHCQHAIEQFFGQVQYHYDELVKNLQELHKESPQGCIRLSKT